MHLGDEALFVSAILAWSALMLLLVVGGVVLLRARLRQLARRLSPSWRSTCALASLLLTLAYLFHDGDLAARLWLWVAVGVVWAIACSGFDARTRGWVLRASWVIVTWQALVGAKLTILPTPSPTAALEASRLLMFNFCQSLLYPVLLLSERFALPGVTPFLESVVTEASRFGAVALISTLALTNIGVIWLFDALLIKAGDSSDEAVSAPRSSRSPLLVFSASLLAGVFATVWIMGEEVPSMWLSGLIVLAMMIAPVVLAELSSGSRHQHRRWAVVGALQIGLGVIALAGFFPDWFRLVGVLCALSGSAIVLWRGAALALVRADSRIRTAWTAALLLLWFILPAIVIAIFILGCLDILLDIRTMTTRSQLARRRMHIAPVRSVTLWSVVATAPLLVWCGVVVASAMATIPTTSTTTLRPPTLVLPAVPSDPWEVTAALCTERGERPCTALEVACDPERCGESFAGQLSNQRALITFPDEQGLGRPFAELAGWTPQWRADVGTLPRQFSLPRGARADVTFSDHRLSIYCCPPRGQEASRP